MKEKYKKYIEKNFSEKSKELLYKQIDLFNKPQKIKKTKYKLGDQVFLKKGTYMHGIPRGKEIFDWTVQNGFIGNEFTSKEASKKIKNSIGMWKIKEDTYLKNYIINYSGFTITYTIGRGPDSKEISEMIPYHKFDEYTEKINNEKQIWMYWGNQTKEIRFMPSLVSNKRQIAFILNTESDYAQELIKADVWNPNLDKELLKDFIDYRYIEKFLKERLNRNAQTTDRETAIMFGLPPILIEGVLVGREIENNKEILKYIKSKLQECYICNLEGKVIY